MSSEDQKDILVPPSISQLRAEIGSKLLKPSNDRLVKSQAPRQPLSDKKQKAKKKLKTLLDARNNAISPRTTSAAASVVDPALVVANHVNGAPVSTAIPTPPPLPQALTPEQKKAKREAEEKRKIEQMKRRATEEKRRIEQVKSEAEKKTTEEQTLAKRRNSMGPKISDSFRAAMVSRNAKFSAPSDEEVDDWDEDEGAIVSTAEVSTLSVAETASAESIVVAASVEMPLLSQESIPQEPIQSPEAYVTPKLAVTPNEAKKDSRSALFEAIREGVQLKKQHASKEQDKESADIALKTSETIPEAVTSIVELPVEAKQIAADSTNEREVLHLSAEVVVSTPTVLLENKAVNAPEAVKAPNLLEELQQNARFRAAKESAENEAISPFTPAAASNLNPSEMEWNKGFNRIRQRNIPFQYVPEAELKEGIKAFNEKKAAKAQANLAPTVEPAPQPAAVSEPQIAIVPQVVSTVDTDRDYALALHLDELQHSSKESDRQLADNSDYIRYLQETYDHNNKMDEKSFEQLDGDAQKEVRHQNLQRTPEMKPQSAMLDAPRVQPQNLGARNQSVEECYVTQSITFLMVTQMQISSFEASASAAARSSVCNASFFMASCTSICLSQSASLSMNQDGSVSYSMSQSLSYTHMSLAVSENSKGGRSQSIAAMAYSHHRYSSSFFSNQAQAQQSAILSADGQHHSFNSLRDKVEPVGLPTLKVR